MECYKCRKALTKKGSHFMCQGPCQGTFHRSCVKGLAADLKSGRNRIYCNNCEEEDSEEEVAQDSINLNSILKDIQKKVGAIPEIKKHLDGIMQSLSLLSDNYDTLVQEHEQSKAKLIKLDKAITGLTNRCIHLEKCNVALQHKVHGFEQSSLKHNLSIAGIEKQPNENIMGIVTKIGNIIGVDSADIENARRIPAKEGKLGPIIVTFNSSGTRDNWLTQRRKLISVTSDIVTGGKALHKIYINEDLTRSTRTLLWNTKQQLRGKYKYIWVSYGKVLVKKADGDNPVQVRSDIDLNELIK